jgi:hypothetical protein
MNMQDSLCGHNATGGTVPVIHLLLISCQPWNLYVGYAKSRVVRTPDCFVC